MSDRCPWCKSKLLFDGEFGVRFACGSDGFTKEDTRRSFCYEHQLARMQNALRECVAWCESDAGWKRRDIIAEVILIAREALDE